MAMLDALEDRIEYLEQRTGYSLAKEQERQMLEDQYRAEFAPPEPNPPGSQYYVRILNDTCITYSARDQIHFEAVAPACPSPIYDPDRDVSFNAGGTV